MLKADLHIHTLRSDHFLLGRMGLVDGLNTPSEMVKMASQKGLDCLAITDHNVLFDWKEAQRLTQKYGVLVIPGVELYLNWKDIIALGIKKLPQVKDLWEFRKVVHNQGGVLIAPHPCDPLGRGPKNFEFFDGVEVVNGFSPYGFKKLVAAADKLGIAKTCGSDAHWVGQLGWVHCWIEADPAIESVIEAIKKGRVEPVYQRFPRRIQPLYYFKKYVLGEAIFKSRMKD